MHHPDCGDSAATGQSRRWRVVLQHALEHGLRATRHGESVGEDHDRRRGGVHVDCVDAWFADLQWFAIGVVLDTRKRARRESESDTSAGATVCTYTTICARDVTVSTCCVTRRQSVILPGLSFTAASLRLSFVEIIPAIMAAAF